MVRKMSFSVFVNSFEFGVAVGVFIVVYFIMLWLDSRYKFPEPEYLEDIKPKRAPRQRKPKAVQNDVSIRPMEPQKAERYTVMDDGDQNQQFRRSILKPFTPQRHVTFEASSSDVTPQNPPLSLVQRLIARSPSVPDLDQHDYTASSDQITPPSQILYKDIDRRAFHMDN